MAAAGPGSPSGAREPGGTGAVSGVRHPLARFRARGARRRPFARTVWVKVQNGEKEGHAVTPAPTRVWNLALQDV